MARSMEQEIVKATDIARTMTSTTAVDHSLPLHLVQKAKGLAFLTAAKVGFMITGKVGTGVVIARLPDGGWSAPSAILLIGLGGGLQIGADLSDIMLVLNTDHAVQAFASRAQITLGAELGVAVGPVGRSGAAAAALGAGDSLPSNPRTQITSPNPCDPPTPHPTLDMPTAPPPQPTTPGSSSTPAAIFSYSHQKGLFAGLGVEGCAIIPRNDLNRQFYSKSYLEDRLGEGYRRNIDFGVTPRMVLRGDIPAPRAAASLYKALQSACSHNHEVGVLGGSLVDAVSVE